MASGRVGESALALELDPLPECLLFCGKIVDLEGVRIAVVSIRLGELCGACLAQLWRDARIIVNDFRFGRPFHLAPHAEAHQKTDDAEHTEKLMKSIRHDLPIALRHKFRKRHRLESWTRDYLLTSRILRWECYSMDQTLSYLTAVFALGITAQLLAWRLGLPSILFLLAFGFAAGELWIRPD